MECSDDETPERDAAEVAAAELIANVKKAEKADCVLPIVDESAVWIVSVKRAAIEDGPASKNADATNVESFLGVRGRISNRKGTEIDVTFSLYNCRVKR